MLSRQLMKIISKNQIPIKDIFVLGVSDKKWGQRLIVLTKFKEKGIHRYPIIKLLTDLIKDWQPSKKPLKWYDCPKLSRNINKKWEVKKEDVKKNRGVASLYDLIEAENLNEQRWETYIAAKDEVLIGDLVFFSSGIVSLLYLKPDTSLIISTPFFKPFFITSGFLVSREIGTLFLRLEILFRIGIAVDHPLHKF